MVKHTRKNKLGGKKMRNKKVSSRKYKKGGNYFASHNTSDRKSIKVKLYNRYIPDPFGQDAVLNIGDKIKGTIELGIPQFEGKFEFKGYNKNKNELYVLLLERKIDNDFVKPNHPTEFPINPQQFNEKFYTEGTEKKINLINQENITTIGGGGKRRTLKRLKTLKTLKKSKKVKKSRKNRK